MKLAIINYRRTFDEPGAPVVWAVRVTEIGTVGSQPLGAQIIQLAESDDALNKLNKKLGGPGVWDEETLIACTRKTLDLPKNAKLDVQVPPVTGS